MGLDLYADEPDPRPGGCALNVALSLVASGASDVACAGPIGPDGAILRSVLARHGVDAALVQVLPGATPRQPIRLAPDGERTLHGYQHGVLRGHEPSPQVLERVESAGWVYVPVFDATLGWARRAWELRPDRPVALDLMDLSDVDSAFIEEAVARSALLFCGLSRARHGAWIERLRSWARRPGAARVVVTLGAEGSLALGTEKDRERRADAAPIPGGAPPLDTTGCGDAFAGAFLAAHARGETLEAALAAGARRAARVAGHRGAVQVDPG